MKNTFRKGMSKTLVALIATTMVSGVQPLNVQAQESSEKLLRDAVYKNIQKDIQAKGEEGKKGYAKNNEALEEVIRVVVQLESPSAAVMTKGERASVAQIDAVKSNQLKIMAEAKKFQGAKIRHSYGNVVNGFSMEVKRGEIEKLQKMAGVKNVTEVEKYYPAMTSAKDLTQVKEVWGKGYGYQGEGTLISIIDTGIDHEHKDMRLDEDGKEKAKLSKAVVESKIEELGRGVYLSEKVPFGYNYADKNNTAKDTTDSMHGMHVAGISAANGTDEEVAKGTAIDGVAPDAQLLAMKVFSNGPQSPTCYWDDIVAAIEDSVTLGADVINMSLGGPAGFTNNLDPMQVAIKNATDAGVSVVIAAGNDQYSTAPFKFDALKDFGTVGTPGTTKDALTVANFENNSITMADVIAVKIGEEISKFGLTKAGVNLYDTLKSSEYDVVYCGQATSAADFEGKNVKGKIALIERGINSFNDKIAYAQAAGAVGVIIFQNSRADEESYMTMIVDVSENRNIPATFVKRSTGLKVKEALETGKNPKVSFKNETKVEINTDAGSFDSSTSWGTTPSLDFKPEIAGPGGDIYSTLNDNKYGTMSGTSMATPHVAGGQSLIIQAIKKNNPSITGRDLSRLARFSAINTAEVKMDKEHPDTPYSPRRQGSGMAQIKDAIDNKIVLTYKKDGNAVTALKQIGKTTEFELELENLGDKSLTYKVSSLGGVLTDAKIDIDHGMHYDVKLPEDQASIKFDKDSVTIPAKGKATVKVSLNIAAAVSTERFIEGFVKFNAEGQPDLVMPYIGYYGDWSKEEIINVPAWKFNDENFKPELYQEKLPSSLMYTRRTGVDFFPYLGFDGNGIDANTIAISPDGDGSGDEIIPALYHLRNAKNTSVIILDKDGKELGEVAKATDISKQLLARYKENPVFTNLSWNGKIYNKNTGKYEVLPQGQYTMDIRSTVDLPGAKPQSFKVPVKIDLTAPVIDIKGVTKVEGNIYKLQWAMDDVESKLQPGAYGILVDGKEIEINPANIKFENGVYSYELDLQSGAVEITVGAMNRAQTMGSSSKSVYINLPEKTEVIFENAPKGQFNANESEIYVLKGRLNRPVKEFTIEGKNVKVNGDLTFSHEVKLNQGVNRIPVLVKDLNGEIVTEYAIKGYCDTIAPVLALDMENLNYDKTALYVKANQDKVTLTGKVSDNTWGYKFYINGNIIEDVDSSLPGTKFTERIFNKEIAVKVGDAIELKVVDGYNHETVQTLKVQELKGWIAQGNGKWKYYNPSNNEMKTGWAKVDNVWYFLGTDGIMKTGWQSINGHWYYLNENGAMATGWKKVNGHWYYLNDGGDMATGWKHIDGNWYYLHEGGDMATGWVQWRGKWYFMYNDGSMAVNTVVNGSKIGLDGAWIQ